MTTLRACAMLLPIVGLAASAEAIVIRHDISDETYLNYAQEEQFAPVGRMIFQDGDSQFFSGSGTLIGSQWVLTAAHVAENAADTDWFFDTGSGTQRVQADAVHYHPEWFNDGPINGDMALIHLSEPILNVDPAQLWSGSTPYGEEVSLVGFGGTGDGINGWNGGYDLQRRAGTNVLESIDFFGAEYLGFDFDDPAGGEATDLESMLMFGDSGGAIMAQTASGWELIGVNTFIAVFGDEYGLYGDLSGSTSVEFHNDWIQSVIPAPSVLTVYAIALAGLGRRRRSA